MMIDTMKHFQPVFRVCLLAVAFTWRRFGSNLQAQITGVVRDSERRG